MFLCTQHLFEELPQDDLETARDSISGHHRRSRSQLSLPGEVTTATAGTQTTSSRYEEAEKELGGNRGGSAAAFQSLVTFGSGSLDLARHSSTSSGTNYGSVFEVDGPAAEHPNSKLLSRVRLSGDVAGSYDAGLGQRKQQGVQCLDVVATSSYGSSPPPRLRRTHSARSSDGAEDADIDRILAEAVLSAPITTLQQQRSQSKPLSLRNSTAGVVLTRSNTATSLLLPNEQYGSPMWYQVFILMQRFFRSWMRTPIMILAEAAQYVILGVFTGLLYLKTPNVLPDAPYDKMSSVFLTLCLLAFTPSYTALIVWDYERQLLRRESATGTYRRWVLSWFGSWFWEALVLVLGLGLGTQRSSRGSIWTEEGERYGNIPQVGVLQGIIC